MVALLAEPPGVAPDSPAVEPVSLDTLIRDVAEESTGWVNELLVTIGRASMISGLKESQIRYYEELGALQPATTTGRTGASRLYSIGDLRRLRVLARLSTHVKAAEAADIVRRNAAMIDHELPIAVETALAQERSAVADGFFLARIISQIIAALQVELDLQAATLATGRATNNALPTPQVIGLIYPGHALVGGVSPSPTEVAEVAEQLRCAPTGALVALCRPDSDVNLPGWAPDLRHATGSDTQTLLFYSAEPRPILDLANAYFAAYVPVDAPDHALFIALNAPLFEPVLAAGTLQPGRSLLLDRLLQLAHAIFQDFRRVTHGRGYRYRSDGFPLDLTRQSYGDMLTLIANVIFPDDPHRMAALLVPDGLDHPGSLAILAHHGYRDDLLARATISLDGRGQGLSGRAYVSREPYVSLHVNADGQRVRYGPEEGSHVALAVPLAAAWGISPFGVLYLASGHPDQSLDSVAIYCALVIADILSELLGRWWLTRLRRQQDAQLHRQMPEMLDWLDSLDAHGPGFARGIEAIVNLWEPITAIPDDSADLDALLALAVLDINHYRETIQARSNNPFPVYAQQHVDAAIGRVLGHDVRHGYWFGNDHVLLVLDRCDGTQASTIMQRIVEQVSDSPVQLPGRCGATDFISVCGAIKVISYRSLRDLACGDGDTLRRQMGAVVDLLRMRAGRPEPSTPQRHGTRWPIRSVFLVK